MNRKHTMAVLLVVLLAGGIHTPASAAEIPPDLQPGGLFAVELPTGLTEAACAMGLPGNYEQLEEEMLAQAERYMGGG